MRKLVWFSIGFAAACLMGALFLGGWLLLAAVVALVLAGLLAMIRKKNRVYGIFALLAFGCGLGMSWFCVYDALFVLVPRVADGQTLSVTIEATDYSYDSGYGSAVEGKVVLAEKSYRVKAYLNTNEEIKPGDIVSGNFRFRLTTDGGLENPTNHRSEGIFLLAYPVGSSQIEHVDTASWKYYPAIWRQHILTRIRELFPGESGAFAAALLLGDRTGISYEIDTAFKVSGISHIIAVSGLHISILFGLLYTLLARRRILSCLLGIPIMFLFAAMAGFTPSITRACIMQSLMLIALALDREYDGRTALAVAVLVMLIGNPLVVLSVSFQLSVGCIAGILLFSEKIRQYLLNIGHKFIKKEYKRLNQLYGRLSASVSVSLSATVMTVPLVAHYFGCISLVSVLTNLLTLWIISFIFYGILACLLISLMSMGIGQFLAGFLAIPIWYVTGAASLLSRFPMAGLYVADSYTVAWMVGAYAILGIFLLQKRKQPMLLLTGLVFALLLAQLFSWLEPLQDDFRVTMLDVGQGQSVLLQSDGKTFLVDCGGDNGEEAADITAEALLIQGISRLDGIIVTHYDADHADGVPYLLSRIRTDRLILPKGEGSQEITESISSSAVKLVEYVDEDVVYTFGSTAMTLFAPFSHESDNENSICILFQRKDCGILITGDRGFAGESELMQTYALPEVDVLVAGHHGSAGSTSEELLAAISPEYAFISVGEGNRYGHPADEVLERLRKAGCTVYRTDLHGTIIFRR